ncbi:thymidylate synthase [Sulfitobacter sp. PS-8MA]|uniref:thymidylate synthase n=1 Tax=Sulfitobacter sp. PS-8MA TaxID=3237707 RepID=UPI0034C5BABD
MTRILMGLALGFGLSACGGGDAPFGGVETPTDGGENGTAVPADIAGNLQSFTYNPAAETLTVRGVAADGSTIESAYRRRPGLDRAGYQAYTAQDAANGRHSTAYVAALNNTQAAIVGTGVQYAQVYAGAAYSTSNYSAPETAAGTQGLAYYTGRYVGLLNGPGSGEDLMTPNEGEDPSVTTAQAAEVTGDMQITADFATANVDGIIYNRVVRDYRSSGEFEPNSSTPREVRDLALVSTAISSDGSFTGDVEQSNQGVGEYAGVFGGAGATEVAGAVRVEGHIDQFQNEIEYGVFVLGKCAPPASGPNCDLSP